MLIASFVKNFINACLSYRLNDISVGERTDCISWQITMLQCWNYLQCLSHLDILLIRSLRFNVKQLRYVAIRVQTWNPNISLFIQFTFNFIFYGDFILLCNRENLLYESLELFWRRWARNLKIRLFMPLSSLLVFSNADSYSTFTSLTMWSLDRKAISNELSFFRFASKT